MTTSKRGDGRKASGYTYAVIFPDGREAVI